MREPRGQGLHISAAVFLVSVSDSRTARLGLVPTGPSPGPGDARPLAPPETVKAHGSLRLLDPLPAQKNFSLPLPASRAVSYMLPFYSSASVRLSSLSSQPEFVQMPMADDIVHDVQILRTSGSMLRCTERLVKQARLTESTPSHTGTPPHSPSAPTVLFLPSPVYCAHA